MSRTKIQKQFSMSLAEKMEMLRMGVRALTRDYKHGGRLITGTAGCGKSYAVIDELQAEEARFIHITGGIKDSKALYITFCKYNDPNIIIVFDDVNDIIRKRQNVEILRAAVTNEKERVISYFENKILVDGIKSYQPKVVFKSKVIIITNIPKQKIDPAIVSRTSPIEIIVTKYDIAPYIEENIDSAPPHSAPIELKKEAWNYIINEIKLDNIKHLDFRVFEDVMLWRMASFDKGKNDESWKKFAFAILA